MIVSLIVAMGPKREIGLDNKLLWHIPEDLKNFKKITSGKAIVMGRKTFASIGKPLPNRLNIVVTRDPEFKIPGVESVTDPLLAFDLALNFNDDEASELVIIGGAEIYKMYLPYVQRIYLSEVEYNGAADTFFPELNPAEWNVVEAADMNGFTFKILQRA